MLRIVSFILGTLAVVALVACARSDVQPVPITGVAAQSITNANEFAARNLIGDPSFEQPVVGAGSFALFSTGQTFSAWTVVGASGNVGIISGTFMQSGFTFDAKSGKQFLDLTGTSQSATGVSQTIPTTSKKKYLLTFWVGNIYDPGGIFGTTSMVNVLVNNVQVFTAKNSKRSKKARTMLVWQKFSTTITANSSSTAIAFMNGDPANDTINGLDALSLVAQ